MHMRVVAVVDQFLVSSFSAIKRRLDSFRFSSIFKGRFWMLIDSLCLEN
jgi:hypothetical protein